MNRLAEREGNLERGRREAMEGREAIGRRDRLEAESAGAQRSRLERASPKRRDFAAMLNTMVADATRHELPGLAALEGIRKAQRLSGYKTAEDHNLAHARFEKAGGLDGFNRLHPQSNLRRDDIASGNDAKTRYDPSGDISAIEPEFLLDVARALIEAVRARAMKFPANRRD